MNTKAEQQFFLVTNCCNSLHLEAPDRFHMNHTGGSRISWFALKKNVTSFQLKIRSAMQATRNEENWSAAVDDDVYKRPNEKKTFFVLM